MTGTELKELTESILDGLTIDEDFFLTLLNVAKVNLEEERTWAYLKKLYSSQTASSGNHSTSAKPLPSDFAEDLKLSVGSNDNEYVPVPFEEQVAYQNSARRYYIDHAGGNFYILGNSAGGTIYLYYKKFTDDIALATSPSFPARFHPILAYYVAGYYQMGVDADDTFARMSPENKAAATALRASMIQWDTNLQARMQNNQIGIAGSEVDQPLETM